MCTLKPWLKQFPMQGIKILIKSALLGHAAIPPEKSNMN
jgi:hypothetical protein